MNLILIFGDWATLDTMTAFHYKKYKVTNHIYKKCHSKKNTKKKKKTNRVYIPNDQ